MSARVVPKVLEEGWQDGWPVTTPVGMLLEATRQGHTITTAAHVSQLDPGEVMRWSMQGAALLARAKGNLVVRARRPFADFAGALARAEAEAESAMVDVIRDAALSDNRDAWRAAAWMLDHQQKAAPPTPDDPDDEDELDALSTPVLHTED
jgi:hypothetical protein